MAGLWDVPTRCIEPGKGVLIWLWLATAGLAMITACSILCVPSCWKITRLLHAGMVLLSVYFVLHCIDFTIQQAGVEVTYGYIFFQSFNTVWRTLSDILLLCGFWLTVNRFRTPNVTIGKGGLIIAGTLWVLGLYKLGLQFALCFAWLGFVDLKTIDSIAAARSGFDVGFAALYFAVTFMAMAILVGDDEEFLSPREPFKHECDEDMQQRIRRFRDGAAASGVALFWLLIRSFCEVVIVGQLDRDPKHILTIYRARDICYSLFSFLFFSFIIFCIPRKFEKDPDPWELDSRIAARLAEENRIAEDAIQLSLQNSLDDWPAEVDKRFKEMLAAVTESGTKSAPAVSAVLDALRVEVRREYSAAGLNQSLLQGKLDHLGRMEEAFGDWVPIYKWEGRSNDSDVAREAGEFSTTSGAGSEAMRHWH